MRGLALCGLFLAAVAYAGEVDVRTNEAGKVSLRVTSAPLSEVLDRLARQTGMKVIYDGAPPRTLVRGRQVDDATQAETVANVLEGLGVSYALRLDATGTRVETLLVLAATQAGSASTPTPRPTPPPVRLPGRANLPVPVPPDYDDDDEEVPREETPPDQRPGRDEDREEAVRRGLPGVPGMPNLIVPVPAFPTGPINPLTFPTPAAVPPPSPSPTPPPQ